MTPAEETLRSWMEQRFDRIDDKLERETAALSNEIVATRHGLKPVVEQIAIQLAENVQRTADGEKRLDRIDEWRSDDGPLDRRFHRHSARIEEERAWRHTIRGALLASALLVPVATGVTTALVVAVMVRLLGLNE